MAMTTGGLPIALPVVDARTLDRERIAALRPAAQVMTRDGRTFALPAFYYEVDSWATALATTVTTHFALWEFMDVDVREPAVLRTFPRYVPCAIAALASALEVLRQEVGVPIRISANGGHRSVFHAGATVASPHAWGTAANIYGIGSELLDSPEKIERYGAIARRALPFATARPYGHGPDQTDDHLHVDLGYGSLVPSHR
jgi:hypothetical protein